MKKSIILFALMVVVISTAETCESKKDINPESDVNSTTICGETDPVNKLTWLKDKITKQTDRTVPGTPTPFKLIAYSYKGKTVIEDQSGFYSSPYIHVFNCDGSQALQVNEYSDFTNKREEIKVLYEFK
ncbi:MAG TPA: hypothetical protein VK404_00740 [Spirosoma sp.]|jgi:hypothetical protein|nr:hypothetical protein [Spirosoma sp.]